MKFPDDLEVPENVVQQIQISHNFVESYITIEEKNWNSISYYSESKEIIIVLVLDKYDDSSDYTVLLDEFKRELGIDEGETTEDLEYTLETAACLGCCALAPCAMINDEVAANLTPKKVKTLFQER